MSMRRLAIFEDEWRLLVDLVTGFSHDRCHPMRFELAVKGLMRVGLVEEVSNGVRVTQLGRQVRASCPPFGYGGPRVWAGVVEADGTMKPAATA
ncbi:hypothetical protein [Planctomyces sp. SH-PL14]|uniref:hypothetical protein n=1 Tax=Planctomyces sp. SH-PL14 TaxID=1632864 RepID=UPI00078C3DF6|nr:hypothetical protein [Planctomyces sp. SH-PL14]AMV16460.1 hypothetical protein VT03_01130 [Planctomyces sp. SH-PL14]